ncbi:low-density lipoprotein receptor-related protein 2-like protein [Euroglyphus maynei]|uniref:Low-density lipoprotein receptor-related protein 2-like protein n=1 Tax=Euroglyphus maynei TaxID=6958 RepID=A0A1Y3B2D1_EURMA|nr:low-density lipoprotein receptor-related protein 2-like protein [Euroglyphus maynei]
MTEPYSLAGSTGAAGRGNIINNNRNPHKKHQLNGFVNTNLNGNGKIDCNTLTTTTTTISGLDTLQTDMKNLLNGGSSNTNNMNPINPSSIILTQTESLIERNVTGASSTSSSANIAAYAQQAINPPPSPVTQRSQCSTLSSSLFVTRPRPGRSKNNGMFGNSGSKNRKKTSKNKNKWSNKSSNRGPPPTPCSTDVYEDIEPSTIKYVYYDNNQTEMNEYDYKPPPPTPRYFSDPSCPPSPDTERSYCNPYPPPPSPVQEDLLYI